jgi:phosphate transport system substrate-binding protein
MRKILPALPALCIVALLLMFPGRSSAAETVRINGSGSALDMLKPLVEAYRKNNREISIVIEKPLGSSGAIKALLANALDVVVSSRPLKPEEITKGAQAREYGRTPLAIITEKSVRKHNITTRELEEIYAGKTSHWPSGEKIRLVLRPREDMDTHILRGLSPAMNAAITAAQSQHGMIISVTDPEAYTAVAKTPGALGATGLASIITEKLQLNTLSLNGVKPTPENLAGGTYPLYKEINFVTTPATKPAALKFVSFVYSPQGRSIAKKCGILITAGVNANK